MRGRYDFWTSSLRAAKNLKAVFTQWADLNDRYARVSGGDFSYWHNERPNVGFLSTAVWNCYGKSYSLEEYVCPRKRGRKNRKPGRVDLYFSYRGYYYVCEFKFAWLRTRNAMTAFYARVPKYIERAEEQLSKIVSKETRGAFWLTGVFVVPIVDAKVFRKKKTIEEIDAFIMKLEESSMRKLGVNVVSYYLPPIGKVIQAFKKYRKEEAEANIYPGVVFFGRVE